MSTLSAPFCQFSLLQISGSSPFPLLEPLVYHINLLFTKFPGPIHLLKILLIFSWLSGFTGQLFYPSSESIINLYFCHALLVSLGLPTTALPLLRGSQLLAHTRLLNLICLLGLHKIILILLCSNILKYSLHNYKKITTYVR